MTTNKRLNKVSIGIPFFNPGEFFEHSLKSVFAQSYQNWELILVDDGSTDGSLEFAKKINDQRVVVISDGKNKGLPARLNQITKMATGDFIARMDADDIMHPEKIENQVEYILKNNVDATTTGCCLLDINGCPISISHAKKPSLLEVCTRGGYLHSSLLGKAEWFKNYLYDEALNRAEDRDLFIRAVLGQSKIDVISDPLYFYRFFGNVRTAAWLESYRLERQILKKYQNSGVGIINAKKLIARSFAKSLVLKLLSAVNVQNMIQRKVHNISSCELAYINSAMEQIINTTLPMDC